MTISHPSRKRLLYISTTVLFLSVCITSTVGFIPDPGRYETPQEAVEYVAWRALNEGRPPCVTIRPLGISLFCVMGHCTYDRTGRSLCKCDDNFTGLTCSVYVGKCTSPALCYPHLCQDDPSRDLGFKCVCNEGYYVPDDPKASFCAKNETVMDNVEITESISAPEETSELSEQTLAPATEEYSTHNETPTLKQMGRLNWKRDNISGTGVLCASSDFLICFIEPKEENKDMDALFKRALEKIVREKQFRNDSGNASLSVSIPLPTTQEVNSRADSIHVEHDNMQQQDNIKREAHLSRVSPEEKMKVVRNHKKGVFFMQRRAASTYRTLEKEIADNVLTKDPNPINHIIQDNREVEEQKLKDAVSDTLLNDGTKGPKMPMPGRAMQSSKAMLVENPLQNQENAYAQYPNLMSVSQSQPHSEVHAVGIESSEAVQKHHHIDKHADFETADDIIADLKHTVQTSEHDRVNGTNSSGISNLSYRMASFVQAQNESSLKNRNALITMVEKARDEHATGGTNGTHPVNDAETSVSSHKANSWNTSSEDSTGKLEASETKEDRDPLIKTPMLQSVGNSETKILTLSEAHPEGSQEGRSYYISKVESSSQILHPPKGQPEEKIHELQQTRLGAIVHHSKLGGTMMKVSSKTLALGAERQSGFRTVKGKSQVPLLLFNVTVLGDSKNNTSHYFFPAEGTKGVLITWDIYRP
ncbi:uncharacterized protein LOC135377544 [Ornithodoros turicata]|uniref:uncharacterized protein LOC135377544 n=1 Tax=Ornithodoros turicata TaxID=34597 RepID=UPI00313A237A